MGREAEGEEIFDLIHQQELQHGHEETVELMYKDEWAHEGMEVAAQGIMTVESLAEYMSDPLTRTSSSARQSCMLS